MKKSIPNKNAHNSSVGHNMGAELSCDICKKTLSEENAIVHECKGAKLEHVCAQCFDPPAALCGLRSTWHLFSIGSLASLKLLYILCNSFGDAAAQQLKTVGNAREITGSSMLRRAWLNFPAQSPWGRWRIWEVSSSGATRLATQGCRPSC